MPSGMTIRRATIQPIIACGPPSAVISKGMVMNGPTPIMLVMLSAVAWSRPKRRGNAGCEFTGWRNLTRLGGGARRLRRARGEINTEARGHGGQTHGDL